MPINNAQQCKSNGDVLAVLWRDNTLIVSQLHRKTSNATLLRLNAFFKKVRFIVFTVKGLRIPISHLVHYVALKNKNKIYDCFVAYAEEHSGKKSKTVKNVHKTQVYQAASVYLLIFSC